MAYKFKCHFIHFLLAKYIAISLQKTPLFIMVLIDSVVTIMFGKLLDVTGIKDNIVQNIMATINEIATQPLLEILSTHPLVLIPDFFSVFTVVCTPIYITTLHHLL